MPDNNTTPMTPSNRKKVVLISFVILAILVVITLIQLRPQGGVSATSDSSPASVKLVSEYTLDELVNASEFIKLSIDSGDISCFDGLSAGDLIYVTQPLKALIDEKNGSENPVPEAQVKDLAQLKNQFCQSELIKHLIEEARVGGLLEK